MTPTTTEEHTMSIIEDRAALVADINAEGERVFVLHQAFAEMTDDATFDDLDAAWDAWNDAATALGERIREATMAHKLRSEDLSAHTNDGLSEPLR